MEKKETREENKRKKGGQVEKEKGQEERKKEQKEEEKVEKEAEAERSKQVEKDVTDWTVVTRNKKQKRRMIQIFVKVNGSKGIPMEVSLIDDKVDDVIRRIPNGEDMYVTMHGRVLKRSEKLKSCEVTDGCTIQVTSRVRGGGRPKDKKSKVEKKQAASTRTPEQKFAEEVKSVKGPATQEYDRDTAVRMIVENEENRKVLVWMMEENEDNRKMIESMSEGSDVDMEQTLQKTIGRQVEMS